MTGVSVLLMVRYLLAVMNFSFLQYHRYILNCCDLYPFFLAREWSILLIKRAYMERKDCVIRKTLQSAAGWHYTSLRCFIKFTIFRTVSSGPSFSFFRRLFLKQSVLPPTDNDAMDLGPCNPVGIFVRNSDLKIQKRDNIEFYQWAS